MPIELSPSIPSDNYAAQSDVVALLGEENLEIAGDRNNDGTVDAGIVQGALDFADGYVDLHLANHGQTVPVDTGAAPAHVNAALRDIAAHLAVWYLWHHRGLHEGDGRPAGQSLAGTFEGYKGYADEQLEKLVGVLKDDADEAGSFVSVPITRTCVSARDENSR